MGFHGQWVFSSFVIHMSFWLYVQGKDCGRPTSSELTSSSHHISAGPLVRSEHCPSADQVQVVSVRLPVLRTFSFSSMPFRTSSSTLKVNTVACV